MSDYYAILDITSQATQEEIQQAWRVQVQVWHPDNFAHKPHLRDKAEQRTKEINEAYDVLKNPDKRQKYDEELRAKKSQAHESSTQTSNGADGADTQSPTVGTMAKGRRAFYAFISSSLGILLAFYASYYTSCFFFDCETYVGSGVVYSLYFWGVGIPVGFWLTDGIWKLFKSAHSCPKCKSEFMFRKVNEEIKNISTHVISRKAGNHYQQYEVTITHFIETMECGTCGYSYKRTGSRRREKLIW
jgi:preprotein translocase subunit Sec63